MIMLDTKAQKQLKEEYNHKALRIIHNDYYQTYKMYNDSLGKCLIKAQEVNSFIIGIEKIHESRYIIDYDNGAAYNLECKNGTWLFKQI